MCRAVIVPGTLSGWSWSTCPAVSSCCSTRSSPRAAGQGVPARAHPTAPARVQGFWGTSPRGPRGTRPMDCCAQGPEVTCHPEHSVLHLKNNLQSCQLFFIRGHQNVGELQVSATHVFNFSRKKLLFFHYCFFSDIKNLCYVFMNPFTDILFIGYFRWFVVG